MTSAEFSLSASNAALSGLLYDCCNSESDQVGFLVGKMSHTDEVVINDSQEPSTKKLVATDILSSLPLSVFSFYNASGVVSEDQLNRLIGNSQEQVVGWYVYRRNSVNSLSLRDTLIDRQLREMFADGDKKFFIVCVISDYKDNYSTIEIEYTFYTRNRNAYVPVKVFVDNLAESSIDFKKSSSVVERLDLFRQINLDDAFKIGMPKFIERAQGEVGSIFERLSADLCRSEEEITRLKSRLEKLQPESDADCQPKQLKHTITNVPGNNNKNYGSTRNEPCQSIRKEKIQDDFHVKRMEEGDSTQPFSQEF